MSEPVPEVVTLHVWRVPRRSVPAALARVARDRARTRRVQGARFVKLLGTGRDFHPGRATPTRWALLTAWARAADATGFDASDVARGWARLAEETCRLVLRPLAARGRWSRREPFGDPPPAARWPGPVAALTRARLAPRRAVEFWRAVPPVAAELHRAPGLLLALPVGEAPVGVQGTFSVWRSTDALRGFAHRSPRHCEVVRRTPAVGWYTEELFARFAVLDTRGTVDGRVVAA